MTSTVITAVTASQVAQLRRLVAEPLTTTYTDTLLLQAIERYPLLDERGEEPFDYETLSVSSTVNTDSAAGQAVLKIADTSGFMAGDTILINASGAREESEVILSIQNGVSLTLTTNLTYTHTSAQADTVTVTSRTYMERTTNPDWMPTYDMNAAAADIWEEKAAAAAAHYDFSADGGNYNQSQVFKMCSEMARRFRSRRSKQTSKLFQSPKETSSAARPWVGNDAEPAESGGAEDVRYLVW